MKSKKPDNQSARFKIFHELMPGKVKRILLFSTSCEAWIMEEDCRLSEQIVHEYRGLNLSHPPQLISYLETIHFPLAVRSSSLLEDAQFKPYAGLYKTFFVANDHDDVD